ncbi:Uncharacterised protein [Vibrio cholerae]|nr:Uncharacterised protein [Vibrio cholerae]
MRAFEHDFVATLTRCIQFVGYVDNHRSQQFCITLRLLQYRFVAYWFYFVEVLKLEVMECHHFLQFLSKRSHIE